MIVNFWATWCAPCRREIPLLRELQKQHGAEGFQIVGVAVDVREDVVKYAQEIGIDYPVLIGEQDGLDAVNKFGQGSLGFPFTVFTDNQDRIVLFHLGEIHQEQADVLLGAVREVNSGKLTPEAARVVAAKQLAAMAPDPADRLTAPGDVRDALSSCFLRYLPPRGPVALRRDRACTPTCCGLPAAQRAARLPLRSEESPNRRQSG